MKRKAKEIKINTRSTILLVITIISLAAILYWIVWSDAPFISSDSLDYMKVGGDLRDGRLDSLHDRTIGYPLLLVLTNSVNEPSRMLYVVQLILHLFSVFLLAYLLIRVMLPRMFIIIFLALSLLPPSMAFTAYVLTETLTEFFLVVGTVLLVLWLEKGNTKNKTLLLLVSGMALGLLALVRPTYQLLPAVLALILLLLVHYRRTGKKRWLVSIIATFTLSSLIICGYCTYNYNNFGFFGLAPAFGLHLSTRTSRVVERLPNEYAEVREILVSNRDSTLVERYSQHYGENYIWRARPELERITGLDKTELSKYMLKLNLILIKKAPLQYLKDVTSAVSLYWFPSTTKVSNFGSRSVQLLWSVIHFIVISIFFLVVFLLANLILVKWFLPYEIRRRVFPKDEGVAVMLPSFIISISIIIYTMLVSTMFEAGHQRYRTPTDLLIFYIVILGIHYLIRVWSASKKLHQVQVNK